MWQKVCRALTLGLLSEESRCSLGCDWLIVKPIGTFEQCLVLRLVWFGRFVWIGAFGWGVLRLECVELLRFGNATLRVC